MKLRSRILRRWKSIFNRGMCTDRLPCTFPPPFSCILQVNFSGLSTIILVGSVTAEQSREIFRSTRFEDSEGKDPMELPQQFYEYRRIRKSVTDILITSEIVSEIQLVVR